MKTLLLSLLLLLAGPLIGLAKDELPKDYKSQILRSFGVTDSSKQRIVTFYEPAVAKITAQDGSLFEALAVLVEWTPRNEKGDIALLVARDIFVWPSSPELPVRLSPSRVTWVTGEPKREKN